MSKLSARIIQHKRKRKIRRLTYPPCTMSHFAFLRQRCAYRLGKGRSMRCSKFKGERGDASRSKRHCYLSISKDPPPTKAEQKIKAQNRTYVYVRFWASLMFFCLPIFCVPIVCLYVFLFVFSPWRRRKPFRLAKAGDQKPLDSAKQKASPFGGG